MSSNRLQLGANDYITKPVDFAVALARVTKQVARRRDEMELLGANTRAGAGEDPARESRVSERSAKLRRGQCDDPGGGGATHRDAKTGSPISPITTR